MNSRDKKSARWLLPGIVLVFACAGVTLLAIRHYSGAPKPPVAAVAGEQRLTTSFATATNPPLSSQTATNISKAETGEDRVVALVSEGNRLLERRDYAGAADKYEQAVRIDPGAEDLHYNLAIALAKLGKTEEAKKQYAETLQIYPEYADAHNNLGNLLMSENKLAEAIEHFREAIKIMPENASFHNNLGTAFGRQGNPADARVEFKEAARLKPDYVEARVNLGNACLAAGQVDEAVAELEEALRLRPGFPPALQTMQRARQRQSLGSSPK